MGTNDKEGNAAQSVSGRRSARFGATAGCLLSALLTTFAAPAAAQSGGSNAWQFEFTPYLWAAAMKGDVQGGSLPQMSVDIGFSKIWDNLDFGAMGTFEGRKGRWGFLVDAIYMKLGTSATAYRTGPGPIGAPLTVSADLKMEQTMLAAAATYRLSEGTAVTDLVAGARYVKLDVTAQVDATLFSRTGIESRSGDKDWVDPYVGLRVQYPVNQRLTLVAYGDYGGFGVGSDSTWQAILGVSYDFSRTISGKFGYRYLSIDYDKNGFLYDMDNSGIYAGAGFRF